MECAAHLDVMKLHDVVCVAGWPLGTTLGRSAQCGASTPWYRSMWKRGGGMAAQSRAMKFSGLNTTALVPSAQAAFSPSRTPPSGCSSSRSCARGGLAAYRQPLQAAPVGAGHGLGGVNVDPAQLRAERLANWCAPRRTQHAQHRSSRALPEQLLVACGRLVAGAQRGLLERELVL